MLPVATALAGMLMCGGVAQLPAAQDQVYRLRFVPRSGQVLRYDTKGVLSTPIGEANLASTVVYTVTNVAGDGTYTLQITTENAVVTVGQQVIRSPAPMQFQTYRPSGELVEVRSGDAGPGQDALRDNAGAYRMTVLTRFYPPEQPVKIGDSWSRELKADGRAVRVPIKATYTAEALEKLGDQPCVRIKSVSKEVSNGASATVEAVYWIHAESGVEVKSQATWSNVIAPGSPEPINGTMGRTLLSQT